MWVDVTCSSGDGLDEKSFCFLLDMKSIKSLHVFFSYQGLAKVYAMLEREVMGCEVVGEDVLVEMRRGLHNGNV